MKFELRLERRVIENHIWMVTDKYESCGSCYIGFSTVYFVMWALALLLLLLDVNVQTSIVTATADVSGCSV